MPAGEIAHPRGHSSRTPQPLTEAVARQAGIEVLPRLFQPIADSAESQSDSAIMRIVAGRYRRRKLKTNPGLTTRPITDRAKETLFEHLGGQLEQPRVADVFAGTGTLGLESLSRGARSVVFVEQDARAIDLLKDNIAMLGVGDECLCWRTDALRSSFRPRGVPDFLPFDLIFFDPPFRMVASLHPRLPIFRSLERLSRLDVSAEDAILCLRTPPDAEFEVPEVWEPIRTIHQSGMDLFLYEKVPPSAETPAQVLVVDDTPEDDCEP